MNFFYKDEHVTGSSCSIVHKFLMSSLEWLPAWGWTRNFYTKVSINNKLAIVKLNCIKCSRKAIKYRCIGCKTPICNVCSTPCTSETQGYSEETYCVGKCDACQHGRKRKVPDDSTEGKVRHFNKKSKTALFHKQRRRDPQNHNPRTRLKTTNLSPLLYSVW